MTRAVSTIVGFAFGLLLMLSAFGAAGFGHGSYLLLGVVSAPFYFGGVIAALVATPLLWSLVSWFAAAADPWPRRVLVLLMALHYVGAIIVVTAGPYTEWHSASQVFSAEAIGAIAYIATQLYVWLLFRRDGN